MKILVFDEEDLTKTLIESYLKDLSFSFVLEKYNEFDEAFIKDSHDKKIIIVNINKMNSDKLLAAVSLYSNKKNNFIIISYDKSTDLKVRILRAGAVDFMQKPLIKSDFIFSLQMIYKQNILDQRTDNTSWVFTAVSLEKGLGKTNILLNTAKEVADLSNDKVLLIDFNNSLNDISFLLNIDIKYNSNYYFNNLNEDNAENLLKTVPAYKNSSLYIMANGFFGSNSGKVDLGRFDYVLQILKKYFKYTFIDICNDKNLLRDTIIKFSDILFYVFVPNIDIADKIEGDINSLYKSKKIFLVCNKYEVKYEPNIEKVKDTVELPVNIRIPKNFMAMSSAKESYKTLKEVSSELDIVKAYNKFAGIIINRD